MDKCMLTCFFLVIALEIGLHANDVKPKISICQEPSAQQFAEQPIQEKIEETKSIVARTVRNDEIAMSQFNLLIDELITAYSREKGITLDEAEEILQAVQFSTEKHRFQTRKNRKTPYVSHCFEVAYKVMSVGQVRDLTIILASLLHDTLKDTQTTAEEIKGRFGENVAKVVDELTGNKNISLQEKKRQEIINASYRSKPVAIVQLADILCNTLELLHQPPQGWSRAHIDQYFQWARTVVDRLPVVNSKLKEAVVITLNQYWEMQGSSS